MQRFAPAEQRFAIDETQEAVTIYQRFAFLKSLISGESFEAAIHEILRRPHRAWVEEEELRRPGQGIATTSAVARQLSTPGPRVVCDYPTVPAALHSLPSKLKVPRKEETRDTPENRFVKFALTRWRAVITELRRILEKKQRSVPVERGLRETKAVEDRIDALLSEELFREVGELAYFPADSQVLQKREGYRDVFRTYVQFEAAALLTWQGGEDVYSAGQRDVATLYEYWVFFHLARIVSKLCQEPFDWKELLELNESGLGIKLRRGEHQVLSGTVTLLGRRLRVELWFNRTFGTRSGKTLSWTRPMRPDCSLLIQPDEQCQASFYRVWLHFDAKYRVEALENLFGKQGLSAEEEVDVFEEEQVAEAIGETKRADLLKMHAYRDAIRRSAGAYVIYPGNKDEKLPQYHEILPGIGAFALRPTEIGDAEGASSLVNFIEDVLDHIASQITQHERWRFWTEEIYKEENRIESVVRAAPFLSAPPADTLVLLGYVKNRKHLRWIRETQRYNLRADKRRGSVGLRSGELAADLVLLYGPKMQEIELWRVTGEPELVTRERLVEMGYPNPRGQLYYCLVLQEILPTDDSITMLEGKVETIRAQVAPKAPFGAPVTTTWLELMRTSYREQ